MNIMYGRSFLLKCIVSYFSLKAIKAVYALQYQFLTPSTTTENFKSYSNHFFYIKTFYYNFYTPLIFFHKPCPCVPTNCLHTFGIFSFHQNSLIDQSLPIIVNILMENISRRWYDIPELSSISCTGFLDRRLLLTRKLLFQQF